MGRLAQETDMVTLQQIADAAGVSRGTVDRALNNRARIKPEVKEKILRIADEMGYQTNYMGRALAMSKRSIKIGMIIQSIETPFMQDVLRGAEEAARETQRLGVEIIIKKLDGSNAENTIKAMGELLAEGVKGIALTAVEDERLRIEINRYFDEYEIPIITFNKDITGTKRICYVGQDMFKGGRTAAGLMAEIVPPKSDVLIISGYPSSDMKGSDTVRSRDAGFISEFKKIRRDVRLLDTRYAYDKREKAREIVRSVLEEKKSLSGIYLSHAGADAVCEELAAQSLAGKIKVISNDIIPTNIKYLKKNAMQFLIGQDAFTQGHEPIVKLYDLLVDGVQPKNEFEYTEIVIKTRYNV